MAEPERYTNNQRKELRERRFLYKRDRQTEIDREREREREREFSLS